MQHYIYLNDLNATETVARELARIIVPNFVLSLVGNLGAGKTTLVRAILQAKGVRGSVKSPTFTLVEPYAMENYTIFHFDLYRFSDAEEWIDAGFDDYFQEPYLCFIEWADKAAELIPVVDWRCNLACSQEGGRALNIESLTETGDKCLNQLIKDAVI